MEKAETSWAEIREIVAENSRQIAENSRQMAEAKVEFDRKLAASAAEFDRKRAADMADFDRKLAEDAAEFDRNLAAESSAAAIDLAAKAAEFDREMIALRTELKAGIKDANKRSSGISDSNGMFAEEYFLSSLKKKLTFAGIHFDDVDDRFGGKLKLLDGSFLKDQFDIVLINDEAVAIIEVKYRARVEDVNTLVDRKVKNFRILHPYYENHRIYFGFGAMTFEKGAVDAAKERGIGILRQVGESVEEEGSWEVTAH